MERIERPVYIKAKNLIMKNSNEVLLLFGLSILEHTSRLDKLIQKTLLKMKWYVFDLFLERYAQNF